jgi:ABC-type transport system substrate-binding protein
MNETHGHSVKHERRLARRSLLVWAAMLALLLAVLLSACGSSTTPTEAGATPVAGGTLKSIGAGVMSLDPALYVYMDEMTIDHCLYETLYSYAQGGLDKGMELEPGLAADMPEVSADGKVYRITLREDSHFAPPVDRAVTAEDVRYSLERMLREPRCAFTYFYDSIDGVDEFIKGKTEHLRGLSVLDEKTLEITLSTPDPTILFALAHPPASVVPKEWAEKWGDKFGQHPLGSGPFMLDEWPEAFKIFLKRNPNFYDAEHVWLDAVQVHPYSVKLADMWRVQRGALNISWLSEADYVKISNDPQWRDYVTQQQQVWMYYIVMNAEMEPFDDVRVRQAFNWAIDRERMAKMAGKVVLWQVIPEGMPGFVEGGQFYGFDPERARQLLADAGYPDGLTVTLSVVGGSDLDSRMAQAMQQDLKESGIELKLDIAPALTYREKQTTPHTLALSQSQWLMDYPDPYSWIRPLFSREAAVKDGTNVSFWWDQQVEDMLVAAQAEPDPDERIAQFSDIQKAVSDGAPIVPIWQNLAAALHSPDVGGFYIHPVYNFDFEHYWMQEPETE